MSDAAQNMGDDKIWETIRAETQHAASQEPILASFLHATVLKHESLEDAMSFHLAGKLADVSVAAMLIREVIDEAFASDPQIRAAIRCDIQAVRNRDPASEFYYVPMLFFKGFHALQSYRVAHWLWGQDRRAMALHLQSRISEVFAADIHPAACIGHGILLDHGTAVVIGETAVVENNVSMLHEVTLGGTGKATGDRHPKVRQGVLVGAGAKILGNVEIGTGAKIAACSVVLEDVPAHCTVAGIPAKIVGRLTVAEPALDMDHMLPHHHADGSGI